MPDFLVDTDVLVDSLRGAARFEAPADSQGYCSVVTRAELKAGPASHEDSVELILRSLVELPVDPEVANAAGLIRRETGVGMPDALIAATAMLNGLPLWTRNVRDFGRIDGLQLATAP